MNRASSMILAFVFAAACVDKKPAPAQMDAAPTVASGAVAPASASAKPRLTIEACEALLVEGEQKLAQARASADKTCAKDDDCALVLSGVCAPACSDAAMTKKAATAYAQRRAEIDRATCSGWRDSDCATITPKPQPECAPMHAACKDKKCVAAVGAK